MLSNRAKDRDSSEYDQQHSDRDTPLGIHSPTACRSQCPKKESKSRDDETEPRNGQSSSNPGEQCTLRREEYAGVILAHDSLPTD